VQLKQRHPGVLLVVEVSSGAQEVLEDGERHSGERSGPQRAGGLWRCGDRTAGGSLSARASCSARANSPPHHCRRRCACAGRLQVQVLWRGCRGGLQGGAWGGGAPAGPARLLLFHAGSGEQAARRVRGRQAGSSTHPLRAPTPQVCNIYCYPDHNFTTASIPVHRLPIHVRRCARGQRRLLWHGAAVQPGRQQRLELKKRRCCSSSRPARLGAARWAASGAGMPCRCRRCSGRRCNPLAAPPRPPPPLPSRPPPRAPALQAGGRGPQGGHRAAGGDRCPQGRWGQQVCSL
jgi:hypothetical protein